MSYPEPDPDVPGARVSELRIPDGDLGILLTVWQMRHLVRIGAKDPLLVGTAASIVRSSDGSSLGAAEAIRDFLESRVRFEYDPPIEHADGTVEGTELLKSPRYMLREIEAHGVATGDCDDVAILGAALGRAAGLPARFALLAFTVGAPYEHVYTELLTAAGWVELDTTRPFQLPSGLRIVRETRKEA